MGIEKKTPKVVDGNLLPTTFGARSFDSITFSTKAD
jgi:hypothetical protein